MLCVRFLVLIISAAFVIDSLKTDVSSNKFDVQAMGSIRGLAGQNGFGDVASKSAFATSFVATPFYNCGKYGAISRFLDKYYFH